MAEQLKETQEAPRESTGIPVPKIEEPVKLPSPKTTALPDLGGARAVRQKHRAMLLNSVGTAFSGFNSVVPPKDRNTLSKRKLHVNTMDTSAYPEGQRANLDRFKAYGAITTRFGGNTPLTGNHKALDIAAGYGTPIKAYQPGVVTKVVTGKKKGDPGYGNYVVVKDKDGNEFYYGHLSDAWVSVGQPVGPTTTVGSEGNSGQTFSASGGSGSHLHLEIRDRLGNRLNPETFKFSS